MKKEQVWETVADDDDIYLAFKKVIKKTPKNIYTHTKQQQQ